MSDKARKPC